jgi:hypothetical protein
MADRGALDWFWKQTDHLGRVRENRHRRWNVLRRIATGILVFAVSVLGSAHQQTIPSVPLPGPVIADANAALRLQVSVAMEQAASSLGLPLDTRDLLYICRDGFIMVNAGVAGFEDAESSTQVLRVGRGPDLSVTGGADSFWRREAGYRTPNRILRSADDHHPEQCHA